MDLIKRNVDQLTEEQLVTSSSLIYEAFFPFYSLISLPEQECCRLIAGYIGAPGTDLEFISVFLSDEEVVGLYAAYDGSEYAGRQQMSVKWLMENMDSEILPDFLSKLRVFGKGFAPMPDGNPYYLARCAVNSVFRGKGISSTILNDYMSQRPQGDYCLHVEVNNTRAIRFYEKNQFVLDESEASYLLMRREAQKNDDL
jgi:ribosomal protein S18 acetylase RimI-like enzyme